MARKPKLPAEAVLVKILKAIGAGAFPYVAARAHGVPPSTFFRWMELGAKGEEPYAEFWERVTTAHSQKRAEVEARVAEENPLAWLRYGPGRTKPGEPGWTDDPLPQAGPHGKEADADGELTDEERAAAVAALLDRARARAAGRATPPSPGDGGVGP
jgi:hypothetical protein